MQLLFTIEIGGEVTEGSLVMAAKGSYSPLGKLLADESPEFQTLVEKLTLETAKAMDEAYKTEEGDETHYRGPGTEVPAVREYLESSGAKPFGDTEVSDEADVRDSGVPAPTSVHTVP